MPAITATAVSCERRNKKHRGSDMAVRLNPDSLQGEWNEWSTLFLQAENKKFRFVEHERMQYMLPEELKYPITAYLSLVDQESGVRYKRHCQTTRMIMIWSPVSRNRNQTLTILHYEVCMHSIFWPSRIATLYHSSMYFCSSFKDFNTSTSRLFYDWYRKCEYSICLQSADTSAIWYDFKILRATSAICYQWYI